MSNDSRATSPGPGPTSSGPGDDELAASPVVAASFSIQGFVDGWVHCQHVADYLARFAASDRFDPEQLTTRLSTYLNEALELVFRSEPGPGELAITISRQAERLVIELRCPPAQEPANDRLRRSVARAAEPEAAAAYRRGFADLVARADETDDADAGLLELVALHGITLALREVGDAVVLCMTIPHE